MKNEVIDKRQVCNEDYGQAGDAGK
jgi:hypothetical protein